MVKDILSHIHHYPYLYTNIISCILFIFLGAFSLKRDQFRIMVLSGLLCAISAPFQIFYQDQYWRPSRLAGGSFGIEDILCNFAVGIIIWFLTAFFYQGRLSVRIKAVSVVKRACLMAFISFPFFLLIHKCLGDAMSALILTSVLMALIILAFKKGSFMFAAISCALFTLVYVVLLKVYFLVWPQFLGQWSRGTFWLYLFLGIPLGEIIWAVFFGFYWPLLIVLIFGMEIRKERPRASLGCRLRSR